MNNSFKILSFNFYYFIYLFPDDIVTSPPQAISLASLQPPLMNFPPLQPRPATTGSMDLMLPLQPKLLPGFNMHASPRETRSEPKNLGFEEGIRTKIEHLNQLSNDSSTFKEEDDVSSQDPNTENDPNLLYNNEGVNYDPQKVGCDSILNGKCKYNIEYKDTQSEPIYVKNDSENKLSLISEESNTDISQNDTENESDLKSISIDRYKNYNQIDISETQMLPKVLRKSDTNDNCTKDQVDEVNSNILSAVVNCDKKGFDSENSNKLYDNECYDGANDDSDLSLNENMSRQYKHNFT